MKKVIIIGANGFLGSNLSVSLLASGIEVIALVARGVDYTFLKNKSGITPIEFELSALRQLNGHPALEKVDTIFHMAWEGVNATLKNEAGIQAGNILYGLSVMEFAQQNQIKRVIIPGSAAEYSCADQIINGRNYPAPSDLYSASKVATRFLCQAYARQYGIDFIWTVITSVYGPGRNDNNLITYAIKSLLNKQRPQFTGLEQEWDYIYIDDLISALIAIGKKGIGGKVYPIGSGIYYRLAQYVDIIRNCIDPSLPVGIGEIPYKSLTLDNQKMDITELMTDTGFSPVYSFQEGIIKTIEYFRSNS